MSFVDPLSVVALGVAGYFFAKREFARLHAKLDALMDKAKKVNAYSKGN